MKSHRFQKFLACLGLVLLLVSAEFSFGQEANRPVKSAGSRKIVIDFPSDILDRESLQKQAGMMAGHMDSCSLIQLETRPECLVGEIDKIFFYKDRLYVLDRRVGKSVFVFDLKGKWISTIARTGHGPGEYINITNPFIQSLGFGRDVGLSENCIISRLTYKSVATALASNDFPERAAFLKKYIRNPIKKDDNPILCDYHLK